MEKQKNYVISSNGSKVRLNTMKYKVLKFIWQSGTSGRKYTDIVKFILGLKGQTYTNDLRGYWATNLVGSFGFYGGGKPGLLSLYCSKNQDKKWILTDSNLRKHFLEKESELSGFEKGDIEVLDLLGMFESIIDEDMIAHIDSGVGSPGEFYQSPDSMSGSMDTFSLAGPIKSKTNKKSKKKASNILSFKDFIKSIRK